MVMLLPVHPGSRGQNLEIRKMVLCVCVCVHTCMRACARAHVRDYVLLPHF